MPDEIATSPTTPTTESAPATPAQPAAAPAAAPIAEGTPAWVKELDTADPKLIRSHPRIAGIVGDEITRRMTSEQKRLTDAAQARAREEAEEELIRLASENEDTLKERYPKAHARISQLQTERLDRRVNATRQEAREALAKAIGRAYHDAPEWAELTPEDHAKLAEAVAGVAEDDVIPRFHSKALQLVAERRAQKRLDEWKQAELVKEREAIRKEEAARLLQKSSAPDLARSRAPSKLDIAGMSDEEYDRNFPPGVPLSESIQKIRR